MPATSVPVKVKVKKVKTDTGLSSKALSQVETILKQYAQKKLIKNNVKPQVSRNVPAKVSTVKIGTTSKSKMKPDPTFLKSLIKTNSGVANHASQILKAAREYLDKTAENDNSVHWVGTSDFMKSLDESHVRRNHFK